ncbi:TPA: hypothetical protein N0F65_001274 [Lagenidium giganteum]|uniref:Uncharacterized protein n=1 Tax=Lagenidium giganteum TaxID=4803 RepID=A0AAV2YSX0_9STRA|nr:TPA: hypothetical protein N0F65_001274 [Lagenidium giganteum]
MSEDNAYWKGLVNGMVLMVPIIIFLLSKWSQARARQESDKPSLGNFLQELFAYEVVLVAGAEMKKLKDELAQAEVEGNEKKIKAVKERLVQVATVLEQKLHGSITPIVHFLAKESVQCIKDHHDVGSVDTNTTNTAEQPEAEGKKDQ